MNWLFFGQLITNQLDTVIQRLSHVETATNVMIYYYQFFFFLGGGYDNISY